VEITNSGLIPEEERQRLLEGEGRGRGIYITHRIVRLLRGQIDIKIEKDRTKVTVRLPIAENQSSVNSHQ
jgi:sensor histidine kinase regulating citrate/malate metabolism